MKDYEKLKKSVREQSKGNDSDDFAAGYDSSSSEDAEDLMYGLENMEEHVEPGSRIAFKADLLLRDKQMGGNPRESSEDADEGRTEPNRRKYPIENNEQIDEEQLLDRTEMMN